MSGRDRLEFQSYNGKIEARLAQGRNCVLIQLVGPEKYQYAAIVLTDDEAEAMGRSLVRRARYSREASEVPAFEVNE